MTHRPACILLAVLGVASSGCSNDAVPYDWCDELARDPQCRPGQCIEVMCWPEARSGLSNSIAPDGRYRGTSLGCPSVVETSLTTLSEVFFVVHRQTQSDPRCASEMIYLVNFGSFTPEMAGTRGWETALMGWPVCDEAPDDFGMAHFWVHSFCWSY